MDQRTISGTPAEHVEGAEPVVTSRELLRGNRRVIIEHGRERYRLLLTKSNKLILTK
ncbi:MAG TPA: hemin uptake protein HemP [Stellaceae bacterium]|nr:hemin uptake protein HemP [Stellaceae bacterium]